MLKENQFLHSQYATLTIKDQEPPHDLSQTVHDVWIGKKSTKLEGGYRFSMATSLQLDQPDRGAFAL